MDYVRGRRHNETAETHIARVKDIVEKNAENYVSGNEKGEYFASDGNRATAKYKKFIPNTGAVETDEILLASGDSGHATVTRIFREGDKYYCSAINAGDGAQRVQGFFTQSWAVATYQIKPKDGDYGKAIKEIIINSRYKQFYKKGSAEWKGYNDGIKRNLNGEIIIEKSLKDYLQQSGNCTIKSISCALQDPKNPQFSSLIQRVWVDSKLHGNDEILNKLEETRKLLQDIKGKVLAASVITKPASTLPASKKDDVIKKSYLNGNHYGSGDKYDISKFDVKKSNQSGSGLLLVDQVLFDALKVSGDGKLDISNPLNAVLFQAPTKIWGGFSNFSSHQVEIDGIKWPNVETYFQIQSFLRFDGTKDDASRMSAVNEMVEAIYDKAETKIIHNIAKKFKFACSPDWARDKLSIMTTAIRAKINQNPDVALSLLSTGQRWIGNADYDDAEWGIGAGKKEPYLQNDPGNNYLGKIYMNARDQLLQIIIDNVDPKFKANGVSDDDLKRDLAIKLNNLSSDKIAEYIQIITGFEFKNMFSESPIYTDPDQTLGRSQSNLNFYQEFNKKPFFPVSDSIKPEGRDTKENTVKSAAFSVVYSSDIPDNNIGDNSPQNRLAKIVKVPKESLETVRIEPVVKGKDYELKISWKDKNQEKSAEFTKSTGGDLFKELSQIYFIEVAAKGDLKDQLNIKGLKDLYSCNSFAVNKKGKHFTMVKFRFDSENDLNNFAKANSKPEGDYFKVWRKLPEEGNVFLIDEESARTFLKNKGVGNSEQINSFLKNKKVDQQYAKTLTTDLVTAFYQDKVSRRTCGQDLKLTKLLQALKQNLETNDVSNCAMETNHDFIQLLFPLCQASPYAHGDFVLKEEHLSGENQKSLQSKIKENLSLWLSFNLGIKVKTDLSDFRTKLKECKTDDSNQNWQNFVDNGHNGLRVSRVISCLRLFGLEKEADLYADFMINSAEKSKKYEDSKDYWLNAKTAPIWDLKLKKCRIW